MKAIVLGDIHLKPYIVADRPQPYHHAVKDFWSWYCKSPYNNKDYILVLEGDLTEFSVNDGELNEFYVDLFLYRVKNSRIIINSGNHDKNKDGSNLAVFRPIRNVEIIEDPCCEKIGKCNILFLPFFYGMKNGQSMKGYYEHLPKDLSEQTYDFCFAHIMDETRSFGNSLGIDLSYLNIKQRVFGHDHAYNLDKGGNYLGSVTPNSYTEAGNKKYILEIDLESKEMKSIEVPIFIDYQEVVYPNKLPIGNSKYTIWTIKEAFSKDDAIKHYTQAAKERDEEFFYRRIEKKKSKAEIEIEKRKDSEDNTSIEEYLTLYKEKSKLSEDVFDIVKGVLSGD